MAEHDKVAIGTRSLRLEDAKLVTGRGTYTDDISLPGQVYAAMVRSVMAHAVIRGVDTTDAAAMPGVLGVFTANDLTGYGPIRGRMLMTNRDGSTTKGPDRPALPSDRVRFVGEAVAFVVAETAAAAQDAAELVRVDLEALPPVTDWRSATAADAAPIHDTVAGNVVIDFHFGDGDAVAAAFTAAAHVVRQSLVSNRVVVNPMEPRAAVAEYNKDQNRWVLHTPSQGVMGLRGALAQDVMQVGVDRLQVLTPSVGGSFGMKGSAFPEQVCLLHAARALGRPVKWVNDRSASFLADHHGRDSEFIAELALDSEGHFLAVRLTGINDAGAFLVAAQTATTNAVRNIVGPYRTPLVEITTKVVLTNKAPVGSYRGAGRPEANYYMSRLIDIAALELGLDPVELRRRNLIAPSEMPYRTCSGNHYDSGEFETVLDKGLLAADWTGFETRQAESRSRGKLRGRGLSLFVETTGPQSKEMGGIQFGPAGSITVRTGTLDYGQGHATPFAQILADRLGVPFETITLVQGDSDQLVAGGGSGGSKSLMSSSEALVHACREVVDKGRALAADALEAATPDIAFEDGRFSIVGTDRSITLTDLASQVSAGTLAGHDATSLDAYQVIDTPASTFPNGCHVAEVEIDPETGVADLVRYTMVNDFGVVVNPMIVEGQCHGGVVQALGQALLEHTVYDGEGQLASGSFMDYCMPRAADTPMMFCGLHEVSATTNTLGVKGCGEAGCAGGLPSIMAAMADALSDYGVRDVEMPATPSRIWKIIQAAKSGARV